MCEGGSEFTVGNAAPAKRSKSKHVNSAKCDTLFNFQQQHTAASPSSNNASTEPPTGVLNISIISVYSSMAAGNNDCWGLQLKAVHKRCDRSADALHGVAFSLLTDNHDLRRQLERHIDNCPGKENAATIMYDGADESLCLLLPEPETIAVGEYSLADVITLYHLHELVQQCAAGSRVNVIFLPSHAIAKQVTLQLQEQFGCGHVQ